MIVAERPGNAADEAGEEPTMLTALLTDGREVEVAHREWSRAASGETELSLVVTADGEMVAADAVAWMRWS